MTFDLLTEMRQAAAEPQGNGEHPITSDDVFRWADEVDRLQKEIERLKGMKPASFDAAIPPGVLPRYMVRWNSPTEPLAVLGDDGYWTPFHVANAEIERLQDLVRDAYREGYFDAPECFDVRPDVGSGWEKSDSKAAIAATEKTNG